MVGCGKARPCPAASLSGSSCRSHDWARAKACPKGISRKVAIQRRGRPSRVVGPGRLAARGEGRGHRPRVRPRPTRGRRPPPSRPPRPADPATAAPATRPSTAPRVTPPPPTRTALPGRRWPSRAAPEDRPDRPDAVVDEPVRPVGPCPQRVRDPRVVDRSDVDVEDHDPEAGPELGDEDQREDDRHRHLGAGDRDRQERHREHDAAERVRRPEPDPSPDPRRDDRPDQPADRADAEREPEHPRRDPERVGDVQDEQRPEREGEEVDRSRPRASTAG